MELLLILPTEGSVEWTAENKDDNLCPFKINPGNDSVPLPPV